MVDYDVVIIGGSETGRYAAATAAAHHARVALVEPLQPQLTASCQGGYHHTLLQRAEAFQHTQQYLSLGIDPMTSAESAQCTIHWQMAQQYAELVVSNLTALHSLEYLARLGVDVIQGEGEFLSKPDLGFGVKGRILRSRRYLLAMGSKPKIPEIEGLTLTGFLTVETLHKLSEIPAKLAIIGGDPSGIELAQMFARFGSKVTIIVQNSHILGKEDHQAARLIQAHLEAEGVTVLTQTEVIQAQSIQGQKWIQAGNRALEVDEILVAAGRQPQLYDLNLSAVGVELDRGYITLNQKLQTTNPKIYGCGDLVGGYPFEHIARYEAQICLKNMLYFPRHTVNYLGIPWAIFTDPQLARVGLTEQQARRYYGDQVLVWQDSWLNLPKALMLGETTGFYQLIGHRNGQILGASIVGPQASEIIGIIAFAMGQGLKIEAITQLPQVGLTLSEMNPEMAMGWLRHRRQQNHWMSNWIETLFQWRRSWFS
jgi:pyruvate/2-oxoglutarate dehydrogenase complex dihydrolipoamide dehydrogenase (E3) component